MLISNENISKPVVLIGMMGVGKTHLGQKLAQRLGRSFIDSDQIIEDKAGCSVSEIFKRDGEAKFRDVEHRTILEQLSRNDIVLATGGGAVMNADTMRAIKDKAVSIWLDADIDTMMERISKNQNRPLMQVDDPAQKLNTLMIQRKPIYAGADIVVDNSAGRAGCALDDMILALNAL